MTAPDEVTAFMVSMTFPAAPDMPEIIHDRPVAVVGAVHCGDPDTGMRVLQPLRGLGTPLFDMSQPMPYALVQSAFDPFFARQALRAYWKSTYLDELTDDAINTIARTALDRPAPLMLVNTFNLGGAVHAVTAEDTAFAERSAPFMVSVDTNWTDPAQDSAAIAWGRSAWEEIAKYGNGNVFLNFTGLADESLLTKVNNAFGANLRRLGQIKTTYDPHNLFRIKQQHYPRILGWRSVDVICADHPVRDHENRRDSQIGRRVVRQDSGPAHRAAGASHPRPRQSRPLHGDRRVRLLRRGDA
jgi:berberine-like enzyme